MSISNALASVTVWDIQATVQWYEKLIGRPADFKNLDGNSIAFAQSLDSTMVH